MTGESGINTVIRKYHRHFDVAGIQYVEHPDDADLVAIHAGVHGAESFSLPVYAHLHGLYWTADYPSQSWQHHANEAIVANLRLASGLSVPSEWVAEVVRRDMRVNPDVIPHAVDAEEWESGEPVKGHILWAKNRIADVCTPAAAVALARRFPELEFLATFADPNDPPPPNYSAVGLMEHTDMRRAMQTAGVFLSTTKETFGVATLEALAAGTPVLGFAHGGNVDLIEHGQTGYLARPDDIDDLADGLRYVLEHRDALSANAREAAQAYSWAEVGKMVHSAYEAAIEAFREPPAVTVVVPVYNKTYEQVSRAVQSAQSQTLTPDRIVLVDDGSDQRIAAEVAEELGTDLIEQDNSGVAVARNAGAKASWSKYICFLDSDDALRDDFLQLCVDALEADRSLHLAYTKIETVLRNGQTVTSAWPDEWDFNAQIRRRNQVPTANVMRRETFERMGGYRQRYAPGGAGAEDAELWLRMGAYGYKAALVTSEPAFLYSLGTGETSRAGYSEVDWLTMHPWTADRQHPFGSYADPLNKHSHLVRQYDEPQVSVIIPVGAGHADRLVDALDSVDAQTYRKYEIIAVWDEPTERSAATEKAFPHVRWLSGEQRGPGAARNLGASHARAPFLVFLDADDHLSTTALEDFLEGWTRNEAIVYSNYRGLTKIDDPTELIEQINSDPYRAVAGYSDASQTLVVLHEAARTFDCELAQRQPPENPREMPYHWCLVTCLIPTEWHNDIGGFDESMASWEDVDYHWRMARAGRCYARIDKFCVVYRFYSGTRRDAGLQMASALLKYTADKYEEMPTMGCGCKGEKTQKDIFDEITAANGEGSAQEMRVLKVLHGPDMTVSDDDMVKVVYHNARMGAHRVIGSVTGVAYGRRSGGDQFLVHKNDVFIMDGRGGQRVSSIFIPVVEAQAPVAAPVPPPPPRRPAISLSPSDAPAAVDPLEVVEETFSTSPATEGATSSPEIQDAAAAAMATLEPFKLTDIKGVGAATGKKLEAAGIVDLQGLMMAGEPGLRDAGLSASQAQSVFAAAVIYTSG